MQRLQSCSKRMVLQRRVQSDTGEALTSNTTPEIPLVMMLLRLLLSSSERPFVDMPENPRATYVRLAAIHISKMTMAASNTIVTF